MGKMYENFNAPSVSISLLSIKTRLYGTKWYYDVIRQKKQTHRIWHQPSKPCYILSSMPQWSSYTHLVLTRVPSVKLKPPGIKWNPDSDSIGFAVARGISFSKLQKLRHIEKKPNAIPDNIIDWHRWLRDQNSHWMVTSPPPSPVRHDAHFLQFPTRVAVAKSYSKKL